MDMFSNAWCAVCGETTAHFILAQGRGECSTDGCGETRDIGVNAEWPADGAPACPLCEGRGWPAERPDLDCYGCDATGVARPGYLPTPIEGKPA